MAVIECVFNYDETTKKVTIVTHIVEVEPHDRLNLVTQTPGLTLQAEEDFQHPFLDLKKGDLAPITCSTAAEPTAGVPDFDVYYHGPVAKFACGYLNSDHQFVRWPNGVGLGAPGGGSGN